MRIRTQTVLVITPIFAALGLAIGLLVYATERSEIARGLKDEASSFGVAIAEFIDGDRLAKDARNGERFSQADRVTSVLRYGQLKRVRLYAVQNGQPILVWAAGAKAFNPPPRLHLAELTAPGPLDLDSGESIVRALEPISGSRGEVAGLVEVVVDAARLKARSTQCLWLGAQIAVALSAVGLLLSVGIASFLTRRLNKLERAARLVTSGDYGQKIDFSSIRELHDLGDTFTTMSSIVQDVLAKARKQLVEAEQFRNPADLAATSRDLNQSSVRREIFDHELLLRTPGKAPSGDFAGVFEGEDSTCFILGRVRNPDPLEATVRANAALFFIQQLLEKDSPTAALERSASLFDFEVCVILESRANAEDSLRCFCIPAEFLPGKAIKLGQDTPFVATTAPPKIRGKIRKFLDTVGNVSDEELEILLEGEPRTAVLIIQKRQDKA